jgi:cysteine desulfurase
VLSGGRLGPDRLSTIAVDAHGVIDLVQLDHGLSRHDRSTGRAIVAVMAANNETGVIQPIERVAEVAVAHEALVLCDAVQAAGRIDLAPIAAVSDFLILSGHKLGGIAGAGALIQRSTAIAPVAAMTGGRQERGYRAGTEPLPAIASFGAAAQEAAENAGEAERIANLRDTLERGIVEITPSALIAGRDAPRIPNTTTVMLPGANAETLVIALDLAGVSVSAGSACSSGKVTASHVLGAMGVGTELARSAIRISTGWATTEAEIETFLAAWRRVTARLRAAEAAA